MDIAKKEKQPSAGLPYRLFWSIMVESQKKMMLERLSPMSTEKTQLLDRIQSHLVNWMAKIKLHNEMGLTDINTEAKDICCGLLNIALDMEFRNVNQLAKNFPAIDLTDDSHRICVKITATADSSKISSILHRFFNYGLDGEYQRLIFLILGEKKNYRTAFPQKEGFFFEPDQDIWDFPKLLSLFAELDISKLYHVDAYLREKLGESNDNISPSQKRLALLDRIQRILKEYADTVKANVSSRRNDILIDAESISCDLLNKVYNLKLVLANQNTQNNHAIDLVDKGNSVAVQITSSNTRNKVQRTSDMFLEQKLNNSYKTLIVLILVYTPPFRNADLLFSQLREKGVDLQIKTLWDLTRDIGALSLELISEIAVFLEQNIGTNTSPEQFDDTSIPMPFMKIEELTDIQHQTFRLTTLLPAAGLERTVLENGLTLAQKHALVDLIQNGFLLKEDSVIRIHPAFRDNSVYFPAEEECEYFLEKLWHFEDSHRWDRLTLRSKIKVNNSLAQLFSKVSKLFDDSPAYAQRSAELWRDTRHYMDALELGQQALTGFRSINNKSWDVARAFHFTGKCHIELSQPKLALEDWQQTLDLCLNPLQVAASDLAVAYENVGTALLELKEYHAAKAYLLRGLKIMEALRRESKSFLMLPWMDTIYDSLSDVCTALSSVHHAALCKQNVILPPAEQADLWEILAQLPPMPPAPTGGNFVGRDIEMREIEERLLHDKVVLLSGLGGMGKTELALCFGRTYESNNRGKVYYVPFQDSFFDTVADSIGTYIDCFTVRSQDEGYQLALDRLERCPGNDILIIDNVESKRGTLSDLMKDVTWQALKAMQLRLILITRFDDPQAVSILPMHNQALYEIFHRHGVFPDMYQMDALIDAVDGHTLTIDLMARTLNSKDWRKVTPEMLLDALRNNPLPSASYRKSGADYNQAEEEAQVYQSLSIVFSVADIPEVCKAVLRYATMLPDDGMYREFFCNALAEEQRLALDSLVDHGWLNVEDGLLTIPPVIRLVCHEELKPGDNCADFLNTLWNQLDKQMYERIKFTQMAELFANAAAVAKNAELKVEWLNRSSQLWNNLRESQKVAELFEEFISDLEQYIPEHPALATSYNNMGIAYDDMGDHKNALECKLKALAIQEKVLTPEYLELATSYSNVGITYGAIGDRLKALEYQQKALEIQKRELASDHPELAVSYNNVGITYGNLGDHKKALEYQQKALEIQKRTLLPDHPNLAVSYNNVGITYGNLGDHKKALECQQKALEIYEKVLPRNHPDLATAYSNVGISYGDLGNHKKALEYLKKALEIREKVLPPEHPDLADAYNRIGYIYGNLGDHRRALEYTIKALSIIEKVLPPEHPSLATSYNNVGTVYGDLGDHRKALEYQKKALSIQEKVLPPEHPGFATAYNNIGVTYSELGDHKKALEYQLKALSIRERVLPPDHPDLATSCNNIAWTYHAMGIISDAAKFIRRAADISRSSLPEDHPARVNYCNWAARMEKEEKMQEAIMKQLQQGDIPPFPKK